MVIFLTCVFVCVSVCVCVCAHVRVCFSIYALLLNPEHFLKIFFTLRTLKKYLAYFYFKVGKTSTSVLDMFLCEKL